MRFKSYLIFLGFLTLNLYSSFGQSLTIDGLIYDDIYVHLKSNNYDSIISAIHDQKMVLPPSGRSVIIGRLHWANCSFDSAFHYFDRSHNASMETDTLVRINSLLGICEYYANEGDWNKLYACIMILENYQDKRLESFLYLLRTFVTFRTADRLNEEGIYNHLLNGIDKDITKVEYFFTFIDFLVDYKPSLDAAKYLSQLEEILEKYYAFDRNLRARLVLQKAYYEYSKGNYQKSITLYDNCYGIYLENNNNTWAKYYKNTYLRLSSWSLLAIGDQYGALNRNIQLLKNIREQSFSRSDDPHLYQIYKTISLLYRKLGNRDLEKEFSRLSIEIGLRHENTFRQLQSNIQMGKLLYVENDYDGALTYLNHARGFVSKVKTDQYYLSELKYYKSLTYLKKEDFKRALKEADSALYVDQKFLGFGYIRSARVYVQQFDLYSKLGDQQRADRIFGELYRQFISASVSSNWVNMHYSNLIAKRARSIEQKQQALELLNRLISENSNVVPTREGKLIDELSEAYFIKSKILKSLSTLPYSVSFLDSAIINSLQSLKIANSQLEFYREQDDLINLSQEVQEMYEFCMEVLLIPNEIYSVDEANLESFELSENLKSSALAQSLNNQLAFKRSKIPDSVTLKLASLKEQFSYLTSQIKNLEVLADISKQDSVKLSYFKTVYADSKTSYNDLMLHLEQTYPNYYEINYNPQIATIQTVKDNLRSNEALLEYFVGDDGVYVFTISQDTAQVFKLDVIGDERIKRFQEMIQPESYVVDQKAAYQGYVDESFALYKDLLEVPLAFLEGRSINKLFIVPDKHLNYLPFELLITDRPETDKLSYKKLNYLLKDYTISYGYSASILFRENPMSKDRPYKGNMLAVAPSYTQILSDTAELAKLGKFRDGFAELKYNKEEVDGIESYFDGEVLKGDQATEEAFTEQFQNYDILHLAMHALVDNDDSDKSKLVFTPQKDSIYDSYLHNFELYNLNMNPKMAVLSACNTGFGSLASGEGVMSLARAFTYAGAESVVMSHWRVDDQASSTIMQSFYKYLAAGKQKDEALRLAKLDYLETAPATAQHPFHWNNFVVLGDVSSLEVPFVWYKAWWVYLSVSLLILLVTLAAKRNVFLPRQT